MFNECQVEIPNYLAFLSNRLKRALSEDQFSDILKFEE